MIDKKLIFQIILICMFGCVHAQSVKDSIVFGDVSSEKEHTLKAEYSKVVTGANKFSTRVLLPKEEENWRGGSIEFNVKVDPELQNYITVKFWGGEANEEHRRLMLFINGKQVGQRHLGEVDELDIMCEYPRNPENFFYKTLPLPLHITKGKTEVLLKIEAQGAIWGYGNTIEKYQKKVKTTSRGIYEAYIHTDSYLPVAKNKYEQIPWNKRSVPEGPGEEVLENVKKHVNNAIAKTLKEEGKLDKEAITFLAKAYLIDWTIAYSKTEVVEKIVEAIDLHYHEFSADRGIVGRTWAGYGGIGEAIALIAEPLQPFLDKRIANTQINRRKGWADMLKSSRDWHVQNRRAYTNQSMIVDMFTYKSNRGLRVLSKELAWPEEKILRLLYESIGLKPWSGSWDENDEPTWSKGKNFYQLTDLGLTRELGYVGAYGDIVNDIVLAMYNATKPSLHGEGDEKLKQQLIKIAKARAIFRYPLVDEHGHRTMNIETVIGWRDWHYPGGITYGQMPTREGGPLEIAASTLDPTLLGYAQQILEDNLYFYTLNKKVKGGKYSVLTSLLDAPQTYNIVKKQKPEKIRLPMTPGQEDFVFADPQVGALAVKHGENSMFVSLYWRARYGINNLARVHYLGPNFEYDATPCIETKFEPSGEFYTIRDRTDQPFSGKHEKFYKKEGMYLAAAGQKYPIAKVPADQKGFEPGKENIFAGKGDFYVMEYGPYLIAMNCTNDETFKLEIPSKYRKGKDLVTQKSIKKKNFKVKPMQTIVLYKE